MFSTKQKLMDAVTISTATTTYSNNFDIQNYHGCAFDVVPSGTGTLAGTVKVQVSNNGSNWLDLQGASQALSGTTVIGFNLPDLYFSMARLAIVSTSGTSTINASGVAKEH